MGKADLFDILLFKCKGMGPSLTRFYTDSEFDHAALVLKFANNLDELYFLDATAQGIHIVPYSGITSDIGNFYEKVVLRHFEFERKTESM